MSLRFLVALVVVSGTILGPCLVILSAGCRARDAFISACAYKIVANAVDATRNHAGQQKYCAPYKCPKEKEAVQNRLSFKAKKGGCDALNSGAGMQMRGPASIK